jgi:hypothetical protein
MRQRRVRTALSSITLLIALTAWNVTYSATSTTLAFVPVPATFIPRATVTTETVSVSFTPSTSRPPLRFPFPSKHLFYAEYRPESDEQPQRAKYLQVADFVHSVRSCQSLSELQSTLRDLEVGNATEIDTGIYTDRNSTSASVSAMMSPNIAASALRRISQLVMRTESGSTSASASATELTVRSEVLKEVLPGLLEVIGTAVLVVPDQNSADSNSNSYSYSSPDRSMSIYALADTLQALSILAGRNFGDGNGDIGALLEKLQLQSLAQNVWERLQQDGEEMVTHLGPRRLVECLRAASTLRLRREERQDSDSGGSFYQLSCERLAKGDALSKLTAADLATVLWCLASPSPTKSPSPSPTPSSLLPYEQHLVKAAVRRFRKKGVRGSASRKDLAKALEAASRHLIALNDHDRESDLYQDIRVMAYTLCKETIIKMSDMDVDGSRQPLTIRESSKLLHLAVLLELETTDPLVGELCRTLGNKSQSNLESARIRDLSRMMAAFERLRIEESSDVFLRLGETLECILEDADTSADHTEPKDINSILRCAALLHGRNEAVMQPFRATARLLFLNPSFLARCGPNELSNFVWFALLAQWYNGDVLEALATRILEPNVVDSFSPKTACRTLSTFTAITMSRSADSEESVLLQQHLFQLFESLGEHLLSSTLTPLDISSGIYAYAKASYVRDMGIFDHLVGLLASRVEEFNVRQVSQSLWACGKMMAWEIEPEEEHDTPAHPYLASATIMATFLGSQAETLTTKDVAQSIWAIGRLHIYDAAVLSPLANRAKAVAKHLTAQEIANIFWSLSKVKSQDFGLIFLLMRRISHDTSLALTPQEAANILYALGRLDIRDEDVFKVLSNIILDQIEVVSASAIANVIWAHRVVYITPPQQLIDNWREAQKLGHIAAVLQGNNLD